MKEINDLCDIVRRLAEKKIYDIVSEIPHKELELDCVMAIHNTEDATYPGYLHKVSIDEDDDVCFGVTWGRNDSELCDEYCGGMDTDDLIEIATRLTEKC